MAIRIQLRNDVSDNWVNVNPVLAVGEVGIETNTKKLKIGDGISNWNALSYYEGGGAEDYLLKSTYIGNAQDLKDEIDTKASTNNPVFTGNVSGINKSMVGLGNVDNTSDLTKVTVSTFTDLDTTDKTIVGAINEANIIKANEVENSMLAQMPTMTIKGNPTSATANQKDMTPEELQTLLQSAGYNIITNTEKTQWNSTKNLVEMSKILNQLLVSSNFYSITYFDTPSTGNITESFYDKNNDVLYCTKITYFDTPSTGNITESFTCASLSLDFSNITYFDTPSTGNIKTIYVQN